MHNRLQILHVYKDYHPILGGIEGNLQQVAELQAASGHDVTVLVTNPSDLPSRETINGVKLIRANRLVTVASTPLSVALPLILRRQQADIVHLHFPYPLGEVSQWLLNRKRPYVITYHSDIVKQQSILRFYNPVLRRVLKNAARVMPTSENYVRSSGYLRPIAHNCTAVPLGINTIPFSQQRAVNSEQLTILFLGRHRHYKGGDVLIRAMTTVVQGRLLIGGDGPERAKWEALASELNLQDRVNFLGNVPENEKAALYQQADVFVLPAVNRAEAFGIVLMEAMASGLPCVTSELGTGTSFVVQHDETGIVVPPNQPTALAAALNRLIENPALRQQMGEQGRERVSAEFTITHMVERIEKVYTEVLN